MAQIAIRTVPAAGLRLDNGYTAVAGGGDTFPNSGQESAVFKNDSVASITVTAVAATSCNHGTAHNLAIAVPAGAEVEFPKLATDRFNNSSNLASFTYSASADLSIQVIRR